VKFAFVLVVLIGIAIGLAFPTARTVAPVPADAAVAAEDPPVETVIERSSSGHFSAVADVNGEPIRLVVDTGADTVALTLDDAKRAHVVFDPALFEVIGSGASGDVRGQNVTIDSIVLDGKRAAAVRGVVLEGLSVSLLGQSYLAKLDSVHISHDTMRLR
jgi:aspartyl protease family protein